MVIIAEKNGGLPYKFILGELPRQKDEWFVDASSSYGFGGICGNFYFQISNETFEAFLKQRKFGILSKLFIAFRELLAALFAFHVFSRFTPCSLLRLNSDNTNAVIWLNKGRCSKRLGFLILSAIEFYKAKYGLKVKTAYIKSSHNTSADALSRGRIPYWLKVRGKELKVDLSNIIELINNPLPFWKKMRNPF